MCVYIYDIVDNREYNFKLWPESLGLYNGYSKSDEDIESTLDFLRQHWQIC